MVIRDTSLSVCPDFCPSYIDGRQVIDLMGYRVGAERDPVKFPRHTTLLYFH